VDIYSTSQRVQRSSCNEAKLELKLRERERERERELMLYCLSLGHIHFLVNRATVKQGHTQVRLHLKRHTHTHTHTHKIAAQSDLITRGSQKLTSSVGNRGVAFTHTHTHTQ